MGNAGVMLEKLLNNTINSTKFQFETKPFSAAVVAVNTDNDTMGLQTLGGAGDPVTGIPHPFYSPNAWIRAYPEAGATVLLTQRAEAKYFVALNYYRDSSSSNKRDSASAIIPGTVYRKMFSGEIEIASTGKAQAYFDSRGNLELRSQLTRQTLSNERLEILGRTGTHIRQITGNTCVTLPLLGDEERFGLIKRSLKNPFFEKYFGTLVSPIPTSPYLLVPGSPQAGKEYIRLINAKVSPGTTSQLKIVDYREGTSVVNDFGVLSGLGPEGPVRSLPLALPGPFRFRGQYFTTPTTKLDFGFDLTGNLGIALPENPNASLALCIPSGNFVQTVAQAYTLNVAAGPMQILCGSAISITSSANTNITAGTALDMKAGSISLVSVAGVKVSATASIDITTGSELNVNAASSIQMNAGGIVDIAAVNINFKKLISIGADTISPAAKAFPLIEYFVAFAAANGGLVLPPGIEAIASTLVTLV